MPEPGPGEVVVQVGAAGACHSDLHLMHDFEAGRPAVGAAVHARATRTPGGCMPWAPASAGVELGQPVAVVGRLGLRHLPALSGRARDLLRTARTWLPCPAGAVGSAWTVAWRSTCWCRRPGTWCRIPDGLDPVQAAPLTDAGLTPYHAVRRSADKLGPAATAVVIGVGGLGHMAVQILRATSAARVIAVDPRDTARDLAVQLGADLSLSPGRSWPRRFATSPVGSAPTW